MFFVVTTGRSGSVNIAKVLSQHPDCVCLHEPHRQLIRDSTEYCYGEIGEHEMCWWLDGMVPETLNGRMYGEADQKLSFLIPILARLYTKARFVWLIRNGRDVVGSTVAHGHGWYSEKDQDEDWQKSSGVGGLWMKYRLQGDRCGAVDPQTWSNMSAFERSCWYWSYTNTKIECDLEKLERSKWIQIKLEQFPSMLNDLWKFLGLRPFPAFIERANRNRNLVLRWQAWNAQRRNTFERWCGQEMDKWYPEWRDEQGEWQSITYESPVAPSGVSRMFRKLSRFPRAQRMLFKALW